MPASTGGRSTMAVPINDPAYVPPSMRGRVL
jgi:hypothetical protein